MNTIDAILFINLDHRKDRLANIIEQLFNSPVAKNTPISVEKIQRISAVYNKDRGAAGCAASHIKALDLAIERGWNRIAIFEDDFAWKDNTDYIIKCLQSIDSITIPWNVLLLSTTKLCLHVIQRGPGELQRVQNAQTTSGYIINSKEYIQKLRDSFAESKLQLEKGMSVGQWSIDMYWKRLQTQDYWYSFRDNLGRQIDSYSDVAKYVTKRHPRTF